ncbi:MAG: DUF2961 domain-containing protein [bacterium]|nr:DUF2961 domain-containing protein [bacterium]
MTLLEAGKESEVFQHVGKGCLTHMWFAIDERVRIRVYVDGEASPSIDMAMPMGHGYSLRDLKGPWGIPEMGHLGGVHNMYRIPFGESVRVTVLPTTKVFDGVTGRKAWWIIRGTENLPVVVGGVQLPEHARLKLYTLEDYTAQPLEEFEVCNVGSAGALYQVALAAEGERPSGDWKDQSYQEGCFRAYFDKAKEPALLSSGLEDYFLSSGYFHHGQRFVTRAAGLTTFDRDKNRFSAYRIHDTDPVFFQDGMRLTLRCGETLNGTPLHAPPPTRYTVYTWVYEWR